MPINREVNNTLSTDATTRRRLFANFSQRVSFFVGFFFARRDENSRFFGFPRVFVSQTVPRRRVARTRRRLARVFRFSKAGLFPTDRLALRRRRFCASASWRLTGGRSWWTRRWRRSGTTPCRSGWTPPSRRRRGRSPSAWNPNDSARRVCMYRSS
jgi:hypothetical protein